MHLTIVLSCVLAAVVADVVKPGLPEPPKQMDLSKAKEYFEEFKEKFHKSYNSSEEEKLRLAIFTENLKVINQKNADRKPETFYLQVNSADDLTPEEFRQTHFGFIPEKKSVE